MPGSRNPPGALDRDTLHQLFEELADELARARVRACIYIIGGAAMTMAYQRDRAPHEVGARVDDGHQAVLTAGSPLAPRPAQPPTRRHEQATAYRPSAPDQRAPVVFDSPHLIITGASAEHLLAMKLEAARRTDQADIVTLLRTLGIQDADAAMAIHADLFPHSEQAG
ncbi:MAG: hypothetical protein OXF40_01860 [Rhodospirillales bacterium]|nr:hypothetical protein [Rhodospirillales bacterium]